MPPTYRYTVINLEGNFMWCTFSKTNYWTDFQYQACVYSCALSLTYNQKEVGYSHYSHVPVALSCHTGDYFGSQESCWVILLMIFPITICIASVNTMRPNYLEKSCIVLTKFFHILEPMFVLSSLIRSYHQVLVDDQEQW